MQSCWTVSGPSCLFPRGLKEQLFWKSYGLTEVPFSPYNPRKQRREAGKKMKGK